MPFTQADADALRAAIVAGRGARTITFSDQSVTFNSLKEMLELLALMEQDVNGTNGVPSIRYAVTSKGA